jgi:hypothetical protein
VSLRMSEDKSAAQGEDMILASDVKNIVSQALSPHFDDEGDVQHRYDHNKAQIWINSICDSVMDKLVKLRKPYKYVVHSMVMKKSGAGMHVCSSCLYSQNDGWMSHAHDLSQWLYCVVTVYWTTI